MANELKWAREFFATYNPSYARYDNYYDGDHDQVLSDQVRSVFATLFKGLRYNLCPNVVDTLADRLVITGFVANERVQAMIDGIWTDRRMQSRSNVVHTDAVKRGDGFVIVWPGADGRPAIYPQSRGVMAVRYEDNGDAEQIAEAVKCWTVDTPSGRKELRVTRYLADRIERYLSHNATNGIPDNLAGLAWYGADEAESVIPNPYGRVPVFHFTNALRVNKFAQSEIKDVLPLQDGLNKTLVDMMVGSEFHGLPQRWVTGLEKFRDPQTGQEIKPFTTGADRIWTVASETVKFGQFDAADLEQFLGVVNAYVDAIARVSRTPPHLFMRNTGDFPSGESLRTAEAPLLSKVHKRQSVWGDVWEDVIGFAAQISGIADPWPIEAQWLDVTPHNESERINAGATKVESLGVSRAQVQRELGYNEEQIETMAAERIEEQKARVEAAAAAFNAGPTNRGE